MAAGAQFHCNWSQSDARRAEIAAKLGVSTHSVKKYFARGLSLCDEHKKSEG